MNKEIGIMIELQHHWDLILQCRDEMERNRKSADFWKKSVSDKKKAVSISEEKLKNLKNQIKKNELEIRSFDEKLKKLSERRSSAKTEKEITALDHETESVKIERDRIEESALTEIDTEESLEKELSTLLSELPEAEKQAETDCKMLAEKNEILKKKEEDNQLKFDQLTVTLPASLRTKFIKLLGSKGNKAISRLSNDICGACNFRIPASIVLSAARDDSAESCTNCGRFIYK